MFVVIVTYIKPLEVIDKYLAEHRAFLDEGYKKDFFVVSGTQNPRVGGIIISQLKSREQLEKLLKQDPFSLQEAAEYKIIEFTPTRHHKNFSPFIDLLP